MGHGWTLCLSSKPLYTQAPLPGEMFIQAVTCPSIVFCTSDPPSPHSVLPSFFQIANYPRYTFEAVLFWNVYNVTPCVCVFVCNITLSVQRHTVCVFLCDITPCVYVFVWWLCMSYALCFFVCQSTCEYRCVCYVVVKGNICVLICVDFIFPSLQLNFLNSQSVPFVFIFNLPTWSHADYRRQSVISPSLLLVLYMYESIFHI